MDSDAPIQCSKCKQIPFDILMMNCTHHLCVRCAAARKKIQPSNVKASNRKNYLVCEVCNGKTALDEESVKELDLLIHDKSNVSKIQYLSKEQTQDRKKVQTPHNTSRRINAKEEIKQTGSRIIKPGKGQQCQAHPQQPVMYFCLTCMCHCFCAQCLLNNKHSDHQVKTIKKAYIMYEQQFQKAINTTKKFIRALLAQKQSIINGINDSRNLVQNLKKQIDKQFLEVHQILNQKQKQINKHLNQKMKNLLQQSNGIRKKNVQTQISEQQSFIKKLQTNYKKGQIHMLNYYTQQYQNIQLTLSKQIIHKDHNQIIFNKSFNEYISSLKESIQTIQVPK